ncbi:MAG TPA: DUF1858 domain-containing protein, partial [Pyrinomonadaceae bacterium]|nr:DUF1858 domain-containing protein [Pyrinomonadaceae bacterium]
MKVTADMKIKDVLKINERMIEAFSWLAPQFERLRRPKLRSLMAGRISVKQAARIADIPLAEVLLIAGANCAETFPAPLRPAL